MVLLSFAFDFAAAHNRPQFGTSTKLGRTCWSAPSEENGRSDVLPRSCRSLRFAREFSATA